MSIIGPRPLLVSYLNYYTETERHRHDVRPGLTGLAQVNGRSFITYNTFIFIKKHKDAREYGNVMCSRGSVIPLWIDQIKAGNPITLTEPSMTRFIMSLEEAVDLVLFAFEHGENGDLLIQKAPACTIQTQAEAVCELFGGKKEDIKVIGIRHGEKMYETLLTNEECAKAVDMGNFYRVPADNRGLNYDKYFKDGDDKRNTLTEFNSNNTTRLNLEETKAKIAALAYIQEELEKME